MSDAAVPATVLREQANGTPSNLPPRTLTIRVMRHDPSDPASVPHLQAYTLPEASGMTLFIALNLIRAQQDASLQFDFVCRAGI